MNKICSKCGHELLDPIEADTMLSIQRRFYKALRTAFLQYEHTGNLLWECSYCDALGVYYPASESTSGIEVHAYLADESYANAGL